MTRRQANERYIIIGVLYRAPIVRERRRVKPLWIREGLRSLILQIRPWTTKVVTLHRWTKVRGYALKITNSVRLLGREFIVDVTYGKEIFGLQLQTSIGMFLVPNEVIEVLKHIGDLSMVNTTGFQLTV
jgi:hypothetical protein